MTQKIQPQMVVGIAAEGLVRHFTAAELTALAHFYGTPEGQSIMNKMGPYMADVLPELQRHLFKIANEVQL